MRASGLLGSASPVLPAGSPGAVSVIASGPYDPHNASMPVVVRNNSRGVLLISDVRGVLREPDGNELGMGDASDLYPSGPLAPGQVALGYVTFSIPPTEPWPGDARFAFQVESESWKSAVSWQRGLSVPLPIALRVTEVNESNGIIIGRAINGTGHVVKDFGVGVFCFDASGHLLGGLSDQAANSDVEPQQAAGPDAVERFFVDMRGVSCDQFLVGVNGRFQP